MKEVYSDNIFLLASGPSQAICITTNAICKKDGSAVLGKAEGKKADELYHISGKLGKYLKKYGNRAFDLGLYSGYGEKEHHVLTFPTKYNWWDNADIRLIKKSAEEIVRICDHRKIKKCFLPPVGSINNDLDYESIVKPVLSKILDNRFIVVLEKEKDGKSVKVGN